jgi:hypothetical protein
VIDKQPEGTRSPNLADAVVMAYWPVVNSLYAAWSGYDDRKAGPAGYSCAARTTAGGGALRYLNRRC